MIDNGASALIGKAGELMVAAELMRRGIEVAYPASDVGVDLLAYRLAPSETVPAKFVPVQVKTRSKTGYNFQRSWFERCPGLTLVHVWYAREEGAKKHPEFYVFQSLAQVEEALGASHVSSDSWAKEGRWNDTYPGQGALDRMRHHRDQWDRIIGQLSPTISS